MAADADAVREEFGPDAPDARVAVLAAAHDRVSTSDTVHGEPAFTIPHGITMSLDRLTTPKVTPVTLLITCTINNIRQSPQPFWMSETPDVAFLLRLLPSARGGG